MDFFLGGTEFELIQIIDSKLLPKTGPAERIFKWGG